MMKTWMNNYTKRVCRSAGTLALLCLVLFAQEQAQAQTVEYIHTDALGSPIAVTDANQNVIERSEYAPYGDLLNRPDTDGPGYTGHVLDAATGLNYMQQRYYDPGIGRFLSVDPVTANSGSGANFNRYWYANNNPYKFTDPDGRQSRDFEIISKTSGAFENRAPFTAEERAKDWLGPAIGYSLGGMLVAPVAGFAGPTVSTAVADVAMGDALGGASLGAGTGVALKAGEAFFQGTTLQKRVVEQIATGDNHAFPVLIDSLAAEHGVVNTVIDSRGNPVEMLTMPGAKNEESGTFEYIKNQANEIYHRYFNKD